MGFNLITNFIEPYGFYGYIYYSRFLQSLGLALNDETFRKDTLSPVHVSFGIITWDVYFLNVGVFFTFGSNLQPWFFLQKNSDPHLNPKATEASFLGGKFKTFTLKRHNKYLIIKDCNQKSLAYRQPTLKLSGNIFAWRWKARLHSAISTSILCLRSQTFGPMTADNHYFITDII